MGLFDIDGTDPEEYPDNKGGRPPKTEDEEADEGYVTASGEPLTMEKDSEEWWLEQLEAVDCDPDDFPEEFTEMMEIVSDLSVRTHTNPINVRLHLEKHGIYNTDWREYNEELPESSTDLRVPINATKTSRPKKNKSPSPEPTSGLGALISDSKSS